MYRLERAGSGIFYITGSNIKGFSANTLLWVRPIFPLMWASAYGVYNIDV